MAEHFESLTSHATGWQRFSEPARTVIGILFDWPNIMPQNSHRWEIETYLEHVNNHTVPPVADGLYREMGMMYLEQFLAGQRRDQS